LVALADRYNVPYVVSTHGMLNDWAMVYKPWRKRIYLNIAGRRLLNRAAAVHCTCEGERKQALNWLPRDNVRIVPLSFDRTEFDQLPGPELSCAQFPDLSVDATKLLMLGRLHPVKRVELVIDAVVKLRKQNISAHLYLAGPAEDARYVAQLQDAVSRHDLHDFVHFLGTVDGELKVSLYQACDLFLLPSWQENFGMGVPESLAAQTPAITTRCVDPWREFEAAGARIAEPTAESFAATIAEMVRDPVSMEELAHRGRDHVLLWLDPHTVLGRFTAMYGEAIGQRVRAS
jgi:glycosyltransferase involved in cell wall biosynthesis